MRRLLLRALFVSMFLVASGTVASAQTSNFALGPKVGFYINNSLFMIGGVAQMPISPNIIFEPGLEFVPSSQSGSGSAFDIVLDGNLRYAFGLRGQQFAPWVLGGLGYRHRVVSLGGETSSDGEFRINLGGGLTFSTRSDMQPWVGLKVFIGEGSDAVLQGGVNFYL